MADDEAEFLRKLKVIVKQTKENADFSISQLEKGNMSGRQTLLSVTTIYKNDLRNIEKIGESAKGNDPEEKPHWFYKS